MPIRVPLLFHFNQHLNEHAMTASLACYRGLLRVLRSHSTIPVNIHISGTLINALQWLDPEPLQLIWEGLRAGQFELLGSTYAQNVPYASDDWDNARQIELHQKVLHDTFGVTPVTFWNPERTWRQSLLPIIADAGYRFTLIEDHILAKARLAEPVVVTSQVGAHILTVLYDDHLLRNLFNFAVWFGRPGQLQTYLINRAEHPNSSEHCLTYAEDAEAMGLWGWQEGVVPNQTWHRLDQILGLLEALPEIELIHLTNAPASAGNLSPIPEGSADWMDWSLEDPDRPYHEPGYENWFEFNEKSPKLATFRKFYAGIRGDLQKLESKFEKKSRKNKAARTLFDAALHNYLEHQYEFGCIGIGGDSYRGWKGAVASNVLMRASEWSLDPEPFVTVEDINADDKEEAIISDGENLIVLTPAGGRLLYWFDLSTGRQYVGNQLAVIPAPFEGDSALPDYEPLPYKFWLPEDARPQPIVSGARLTAEAAPTRLGTYIPSWIWDGEREPFELLTKEIRTPGEHWLLPAQRRGFVDHISVNSRAEGPGDWLEMSQDGEAFVFQRQVSDDIALEKRYEIQDGQIVVTYRWKNGGSEAAALSWEVITELTPDYASMVQKGRKVLKFVEDSESPGVRNTSAKEEVRIHAGEQPASVSYREALLGLEIALAFRLEIGSGDNEEVVLRMSRGPASRN